jgi:hypothetical protein
MPNRRAFVLVATVTLTVLTARAAHADPKACSDASDRGQSLRNEGKLGAAKAAFTECAADACPAAIRKDCSSWSSELDAAIPTVVFGAKLGGKDVTGVRVTMDGARLVDVLDGRPVAVDPGLHVFRFDIEGQTPIEKSVLVKQGEKNRALEATFGTVGVVGAAPPELGAFSGATATVTVQVDEGSEPVLEKKRSRTWTQVCTGACNRDVPIDGIYRINGTGVRTTQGFSLDARAGEHVLVGVEPGTNHGRTAGLVLLGTGAALAVAGGVFLGVGAASPPCSNYVGNSGGPQDCTAHSLSPFVPVGIVGLGVGAVLAVVGAAVLATGKSDAFQKKAAALLGAGAAGFAF